MGYAFYFWLLPGFGPDLARMKQYLRAQTLMNPSVRSVPVGTDCLILLWPMDSAQQFFGL